MASVSLAFVSATSRSAAFLSELLDVVADAVLAAGGSVSMHKGAYPEPDDNTVYVVVPHEYFLFLPKQLHPSAEQRARTIGFCVEHPGNLSFDNTVRFSAALGACVDINDDSTTALQNQGFNVQRFKLGYSRLWDTWKGDKDWPRPVDISYMGTTDSRRNPILATYVDDFAPYNCRLFLPPHEPMVRPRPDFLMGTEKLRHLARTKILLNLHRGKSRSLEWVRVLEAVCNGCVVVSERSVDAAPFVAGEHFEVGSVRSLSKLAVALLNDPARVDRLRDNAYEFVKGEMSMRPSAEMLVELAGTLLPRQHVAKPEPKKDRVARTAWRSLSDLHTDVKTPRPRRVRVSRFPDRLDATGVNIALTVCHDDPSPWRAIRALAQQTTMGMTLSVATAEQLFDIRNLVEHGLGASTIRLGYVTEHQTPQARGVLRNQLLDNSSSDFTLVLDSTHECLPRFIEETLLQLRRNPHAQAAYCLVAEDGDISNALPLEPARITKHAYLGGPVLVRTPALRAMKGFASNSWSTKVVDHNFWKMFASRGYGAILVPQILVRRESNVVLDARFMNRRQLYPRILTATA